MIKFNKLFDVDIWYSELGKILKERMNPSHSYTDKEKFNGKIKSHQDHVFPGIFVNPTDSTIINGDQP